MFIIHASALTDSIALSLSLSLFRHVDLIRSGLMFPEEHFSSSLITSRKTTFLFSYSRRFPKLSNRSIDSALIERVIQFQRRVEVLLVQRKRGQYSRVDGRVNSTVSENNEETNEKLSSSHQ